MAVRVSGVRGAGVGEVHACRSAPQPVEDAEDLQPAHNCAGRAASRVDIDGHCLLTDPHTICADGDHLGSQLAGACLRQVQDQGGDDKKRISPAV
ncbi:hypothetical protein AFB00_30005 (plasmid) [Pseudonocardia sp. HH130630-07]|nr:hypothetical protein AFB00_30005 [Pseudonocardia sp. HH130630-07]